MSAQVFARSLVLALAGVALVGSACSHDWDFFDPRLGAGGDATGGAPAGGSPGTGGGGNPSTGGGGSTEGGAPAGGGGAGPGGGGQGGAQGGGGSGPVLHSYDATVADCIDPAAPDPDACALENGGTRMTADAQADTGGQRRIFLRFDLDGAIAGTIDSVVLRVTVPIVAGSESNASGSLWEVAPFTRADLFTAAPADVGASPLVMDLGAVVQGQVVDFELPTAAVAPGESVYFSIRTTSTNGVDYFNLTGTSPPELLITTL